MHERVVTGGGRASVKLPQFRTINTVLSNLKTGLAGTYHAFDFANTRIVTSVSSSSDSIGGSI